jgi:hypothetical protein
MPPKIKLENPAPGLSDIASELVDEIDKIKLITTDENSNLVVVTEHTEYVSDFPNKISRIVADNTDETYGLKITSLDESQGEKVLIFIEDPADSESVTLLYALSLEVDILIAKKMAEEDSKRPKSDLPERIMDVAGHERFDNVSELKDYMSLNMNPSKNNGYSAFDL